MGKIHLMINTNWWLQSSSYIVEEERRIIGFVVILTFRGLKSTVFFVLVFEKPHFSRGRSVK